MMKSESIFRPGTGRYTMWTNGTADPPRSRDDLIGLKKIVSPGAMVKGNFRSPNPWSYSVREHSYPIGSHDQSYSAWGRQYRILDTGHMCSMSYAASDESPFSYTHPSTALYNRALSALNEKVRGELDLSVGLAEAGSTLKMLNLLAGAKSFVKDFSQMKNLIAGVSSARLQWNLGWKPLLGDIYGSLDESIHVVLNAIENVRVTKTEGIAESFSYTVPMPLSTSYGWQTRRVGRAGCQIGVAFKTEGHNLDRWTSLNPISIAYELTPYSFVLDYFYDLGSYIRNLETSLLYANSFVNGYVSQFHSYDCVMASQVDKTFQDPVHGPKRLKTDLTAEASERWLQRTVLSSYPSPRLPQFTADLSSGQLLNLGALIGVHLGVK